MKDVTVEVIGTQYIDGEKDTIRTYGIGTYYEKDGRHYCFYEETRDKEVCRHTLKFDNNCLEMVDKGVSGAKMTFDVANKITTSYAVPGSVMTLEIDTHSYKIVHSKDRIDINMDYEITFNGVVKSQHVLCIAISGR